jgi:hypothetical protein
MPRRLIFWLWFILFRFVYKNQKQFKKSVTILKKKVSSAKFKCIGNEINSCLPVFLSKISWKLKNSWFFKITFSMSFSRVKFCKFERLAIFNCHCQFWNNKWILFWNKINIFLKSFEIIETKIFVYKFIFFGDNNSGLGYFFY